MEKVVRFTRVETDTDVVIESPTRACSCNCSEDRNLKAAELECGEVALETREDKGVRHR